MLFNSAGSGRRAGWRVPARPSRPRSPWTGFAARWTIFESVLPRPPTPAPRGPSRSAAWAESPRLRACSVPAVPDRGARRLRGAGRAVGPPAGTGSMPRPRPAHRLLPAPPPPHQRLGQPDRHRDDGGPAGGRGQVQPADRRGAVAVAAHTSRASLPSWASAAGSTSSGWRQVRQGDRTLPALLAGVAGVL